MDSNVLNSCALTAMPCTHLMDATASISCCVECGGEEGEVASMVGLPYAGWVLVPTKCVQLIKCSSSATVSVRVAQELTSKGLSKDDCERVMAYVELRDVCRIVVVNVAAADTANRLRRAMTEHVLLITLRKALQQRNSLMTLVQQFRLVVRVTAIGYDISLSLSLPVLLPSSLVPGLYFFLSSFPLSLPDWRHFPTLLFVAVC